MLATGIRAEALAVHTAAQPDGRSGGAGAAAAVLRSDGDSVRGAAVVPGGPLLAGLTGGAGEESGRSRFFSCYSSLY